ncbi:PIG-L family deacetylase [Sulfitobacter sp. R18_1]|uniref:PIG-L deacetylase family protein n=1 Tax=Sulfitobacter sp. R18_1 TaxID=2821104 RepID=UPI001ADCAA87|nr:PIG-L family deacetylase [Sulfitobacter sp. R18_1]MBO9431842.1 PIG-L family deacetylase [Sulfitobacter sp. R18_1]
MSHNAPLAEALSGREKIVVLAPHPDDETLGCGGLLARAFAGAGAHVICLTDGGASHPGSRAWSPARLAETRRAELAGALDLLGGGAADLTWLGHPDSRLHEVAADAILTELMQVIDAQAARHIFVPASEDKHCDHQTTASLADGLRAQRPNLHFHSYPVWSRFDDPNFAENTAGYAPLTLDTAAYRDAKSAAIRAHRSQLGQVVQDDPDGFILPEAMIDLFAQQDEIFWRMP